MDNVEQKARDLGWVPLEEFRSGPDKWVDAETFVRRGEEMMPILRQNNRRLEGDLAKLRAENQQLARMMAAGQESIVELQAFHEENLKARLAEQKRSLAGALADAREAGDTHAEVEIQSQIAELTRQDAPKPKTIVPQTPQQAPAIDSAFQEWMNDNPWYTQDARKMAKANGIAQILRADPANDSLQGRAFFDRVTQEMNGQSAPQHSKVGGGRPSGEGGGGGGGGGAKGYDALPPDARAACAAQAKKLVGEGRAFKDVASWNAYYAKLYFKGEE